MTTFVSEARIMWTVLDPRTGAKRVVDPQYERDRRTPKPIPSPRDTFIRDAEKRALGYAAQWGDITRTLTSVGFDAPLAAEIAREFVDMEDGS
jgi:hypothetical protein